MHAENTAPAFDATRRLIEICIFTARIIPNPTPRDRALLSSHRRNHSRPARALDMQAENLRGNNFQESSKLCIQIVIDDRSLE
jgi:hypothetical protein